VQLLKLEWTVGVWGSLISPEILLKMPGVVVEKWRPGLVHPACKVNFQFVDFVE